LDLQFVIGNLLAFLASGFTLLLALISYHEFRRAPGVTAFSLVMASVSLWSVSIGIGMLQPSFEEAWFWIIMRMVGVFLTPVFWLIFSLQFSDKKVKPWQGIVLGIIPVISLVLLVTSGNQDLFLEEVEYMRAGRFLVDVTWHLGPLFWVHFVYSYLLVLSGSFLILRQAYRYRKFFRRQAAGLVVGATAPLIVNLSYALHLIPDLKINYDPVGFVIAGIALSYSMYNLGLFDLTPIAQQYLTDSMRDGMLVLDPENRVVELNPSAEKFLGLEEDDVLGQPLPGGSILRNSLKEFLKHTTSGEMVIETGEVDDDPTYRVELSLIQQEIRVLGKLLILRDISTQRRLERDLWTAAVHDHLTGVYNRRYAAELGKREIQRSLRHGHTLSLILFDLDGFKEVNDQFGHQKGDSVLREVAQSCRELLREEDVLARYGGDEFVVLSLDTDQLGALRLAERLRSVIEKQEHNITASFGVADLLKDSDDSLEKMIQRADQALYHSKRAGCDQVTGWAQGLDQG
jgi:diguanylate cyclase (GGDEF)-like protein/PAS domain S-box-containing protein